MRRKTDAEFEAEYPTGDPNNILCRACGEVRAIRNHNDRTWRNCTICDSAETKDETGQLATIPACWTKTGDWR